MVTRRADNVAEYPVPPVAGTAEEGDLEPVVWFVPSADRSAGVVVGEPQAVTKQTVATATQLRSTILNTGSSTPT